MTTSCKGRNRTLFLTNSACERARVGGETWHELEVMNGCLDKLASGVMGADTLALMCQCAARRVASTQVSSTQLFEASLACTRELGFEPDAATLQAARDQIETAMRDPADTSRSQARELGRWAGYLLVIGIGAFFVIRDLRKRAKTKPPAA